MAKPPRTDAGRLEWRPVANVRLVPKLYVLPDPCPRCGGFDGWLDHLIGIGVRFAPGEKGRKEMRKALCRCPLSTKGER